VINIFRMIYVRPFYKTVPNNILRVEEVKKDVLPIIDKDTPIIKDDFFSIVNGDPSLPFISRTGPGKYNGPVFAQLIIISTPKSPLIRSRIKVRIPRCTK